MTWFSLSWVPSFFKHEDLDVRIPGPTIVDADTGYVRPGSEFALAGFIGTFYPVSGDDSRKDNEGQALVGTSSVFSAVDLPIAENNESFNDHDRFSSIAVPGARLYHHQKVYEFVHKEWWPSGNFYRYLLQLRTRIPFTDTPGGGGGG